MSSRKLRLPRARAVALAVGVGAIGSLAAAPAAFAAGGAAAKPPQYGSSCQTDGKVAGRGSSFQNAAFQGTGTTPGFIRQYNNDVCGVVGASTTLNTAHGWSVDPTSGGDMVSLNYTSNGGTGVNNGSGEGMMAMGCRTDPFGGTDLPYDTTELTALGLVPGSASDIQSVLGETCTTSANVFPPFGPSVSSYPVTTDAAKPVMSFPVAGGAVAIAVNLNGVCTGTPPTGLNITSDELNMIYQGTINTWNDTTLVGNNPSLTSAGCTGPIKRVVRKDLSGTTGILKDYLLSITTQSTVTTLCDGTTWASLADDANHQNTTWPNPANPSCGGTLVVPTGNGSGALISSLKATNGSIGYAELGVMVQKGLPSTGISFVNLETSEAASQLGVTNDNPAATDTSGNPTYVAPGASSASNCVPVFNGPNAKLPGAQGNADAVGLTGNGWALNYTIPQTASPSNFTYQGPNYPACGLTFDFMYTGMDTQTGETTPSTTVTASTTATGAQVLPEATVTVASTAAFPTAGTLTVTSDAGPQTVTYTGKTATTFTGAAGGTGNVADGGAVAFASEAANQSIVPATSTTGFPTQGKIVVATSTGNQTLSYSGTTTSSFVGVTGGLSTSTISSGAAVTGQPLGSAVTTAGPFAGLTNDQLRTLYSFFTYVYSPLGQANLATNGYDSLPSGFLTKIRDGFQQNF